MNDLENDLRSLRLAQPSRQLDGRIETLLTRGSRVPDVTRRSRLWWLALPAAGTMAASLFLLFRHEPATPSVQPAVCEIEARGLMREWLVTPPSGSRPPPKMIVSVAR
jgi:hypothetical protein